MNPIPFGPQRHVAGKAQAFDGTKARFGRVTGGERGKVDLSDQSAVAQMAGRAIQQDFVGYIGEFCHQIGGLIRSVSGCSN